jgi:acyl-CoA thioester hydrolase
VGDPFRLELRVRYGECEPQGIVFNANYLAYIDTGINELLRVACGSYYALRDRGLEIVVAEAQVRFHAPARFEDLLTVELTIARLGTTSITSDVLISRDGAPLVDGMVRHVVVDRNTAGKTAIPDWLRRQLEPWAAT